MYINKHSRKPKWQSKRAIHRNWQHRVHKMKENKAKAQHNICWTSLCANKYKYNDHNAPLRKYTIKYFDRMMSLE